MKITSVEVVYVEGTWFVYTNVQTGMFNTVFFDQHIAKPTKRQLRKSRKRANQMIGLSRAVRRNVFKACLIPETYL